MITTQNLKGMLTTLGFTENANVFEKKFPAFNISLSVDFNKQKLIYPNEIKGGDRNNGFDASENFVVFECINRLLEKGYRPEHIELEKQWHLGHVAKSGRADICVSSHDGSMLFIIECKTWGNEYNKALKNTKNDGAQLFSYWQQEQSTKWLILYASNFEGDKIEYNAPTINCTDDANIILLAEKDKTIKLYRDANTAPEKYVVWKETYLSQIHNNLVFSNDSVAYKIGIKPLLKKDLLNFSPEDKIVNRFEEILRHNNVSDKENAFNRLIALFICKLVDESTKSDNDEVEFQYKQGTDTYETLQDRLQRLHRDGMEKFMREKIIYVSPDYPEWLFKTYTGSQRKKAIEDLQNTIRILKFYSNNDFAFKDVHNEELFYQNGKILVEMIQLFEKYRIVYPSKHQFLGDLFEQLLNKGFKQNEGQFFTPMPISRFIWDSLPIERMLSSERGTIYPKIIDYACGAGHFLTEAIEAINYFANTNGNNTWVRDHIFGIEKDYRLARVAKISLFMNGAGEGNIIFGDGLENIPAQHIDNGTFDILVANPPYSVKDFKQHLQLKNNSFELLDKISLSGGEIETLFVERIAQLLRPNGIAAVILPSSILSNDNASYIGAREQILKNFYIRAIVAFGSNTFGATGTNTVVMFLEKYNEPPKHMDIAADTVEAIISGKELTFWNDKEIFDHYISQVGLDETIYASFLNKALTMYDFTAIEYFNIYAEAFAKSKDAKNLTKTRAYKKLGKDEQDAQYLKKFYTYLLSQEAEKLYYFTLVFNQKTVIIKSPSDNEEQKIFLGYNWSNRKGNEGIQIISPGGKMYDDTDRKKEGTLAHAIRQSFNNIIPCFTADQADYGTVVDTKDILDYSRATFNKSISLTANRKIEYTSKYELIPLWQVADVCKGTAITSAEVIKGNYKVVAGGTDYAYLHNQNNRDENTITISASGANAGFVNFWCEKIFASDCSTVRSNNVITTKWVYYYLKMLQGQIYELLQKGAGQPHVYSDDIKMIPIPNIPQDIQETIVEKCVKFENEAKSNIDMIQILHKEIDEIFESLDNSKDKKTKFMLSMEENFTVSIGQRVLNRDLVEEGNVPVYSSNVFKPFGFVNNLLIQDFSLDSVLWGIDTDWQVNYMPKNNPFYPTDHCGVLRCRTNKVNPRYLAHILEVEGNKKGFSRAYRASIDRIQGISFDVPDITLQNDNIKTVLEKEQKISNLESKLETIQCKIVNVLNKYLQ